MVERSVTVRTPEAIAFYYELAGLGSRFLALCVDTVVQVAVLIALLTLGVASTRGVTATASSLHISQRTLGSTLAAAIVLTIFVLFYGYFIVFEKMWNGQTPGKRLLGIRVVRDGGYPVELGASIIRNLIRLLEFAFGFYCLSVISMVLSSENKRLGDYAAGTIVVRDRGFEVRDFRTWRRALAGDHLLGAGLAGLSAEELALIDQYHARKTSLDPAAARAAATKIAAAVRPKVGAELRGLSDDELLLKIASREG
jgi:uncharacterized RDD family membrane protein YckC